MTHEAPINPDEGWIPANIGELDLGVEEGLSINCSKNSRIVSNLRFIADQTGIDTQMVFQKVLELGSQIDAYYNTLNDGFFRKLPGLSKKIDLSDSIYLRDPEEIEGFTLPLQKEPIRGIFNELSYEMIKSSALARNISIEELTLRMARIGIGVAKDLLKGQEFYLRDSGDLPLFAACDDEIVKQNSNYKLTIAFLHQLDSDVEGYY